MVRRWSWALSRGCCLRCWTRDASACFVRLRQHPGTRSTSAQRTDQHDIRLEYMGDVITHAVHRVLQLVNRIHGLPTFTRVAVTFALRHSCTANVSATRSSGPPPPKNGMNT